MNEHPTAEQLETLRAAGYVCVTTLHGVFATGRPGQSGPLPWREALEELDYRDEGDEAA